MLRLNDQIRPITELLKIAEKFNLAPDVLEPEPSSIKQVCICSVYTSTQMNLLTMMIVESRLFQTIWVS